MRPVLQRIAALARGHLRRNTGKTWNFGFWKKRAWRAGAAISKMPSTSSAVCSITCTKKRRMAIGLCTTVPKKEKKGKKCTVCKHDFPMTKLCIDAPVVVCRGVAKKLGLKVSGRRNAIGKVMGRRRCEWQSGTCTPFAVLFRTNSHTAPNYRVPLMSDTHDEAMCPSKKCAEWTAAMACAGRNQALE